MPPRVTSGHSHSGLNDSASHDLSVAETIRSDIVNYEVALRQAAEHLRELEATLGGLEREEARGTADGRAVVARLRRTEEQLMELEERLREAERTFPDPADYAEDIRALEGEAAELSSEEAETDDKLAAAAKVLATLHARLAESRSEELRALERLRAEADVLTGRVYHRPSLPLPRDPAGPSPMAFSRRPPQLPRPLPFPPRRPSGQSLGPMTSHGEDARPIPAALNPWATAKLLELFSSGSPHDVRELRLRVERDPEFLGSVDSNGNTPLHLACAARPAPVANVRAMVAGGASPRARNHAGLTPFHVACLNTSDDSDVLKGHLVASAGSEVDEFTSDGRTAAHLVATDDRHIDTTAFLIEQGADLSIRAGVGGRWCTPVDVARSSGVSRAGKTLDLLLSAARY